MMTDTLSHKRRSPVAFVKALLKPQPEHLDDDLLYLSPAQVEALIDVTARKELGMSPDEFFAAIERGELTDSPAAAHLLLISGARAR